MNLHSIDYFNELKNTIDELKTNHDLIEQIITILGNLKGRLFIIGIGGSAANASHMVNDVRKLCGIEAYAPTDNIAEFTARTNDEGFETVFVEYLMTSNFNSNDCLFILSVGGGNVEKNVSVNLIKAIDFAKTVNANIISLVGKKGYAYNNSTTSILIPVSDKTLLTPISETMQAAIWHCIVSSPYLQINKTKW